MKRKNDGKNGSKSYLDQRGKFARGNPGRPKGARHKVTLAVEELLQGQANKLTQQAIDMALGGDVTALRLCLERIAPARKDAPVNFALPEMENAQDAAKAAEGILKAVSEGEITPLEGASVMGLVEQYRRTLELTELEKRIEELEKAK